MEITWTQLNGYNVTENQMFGCVFRKFWELHSISKNRNEIEIAKSNYHKRPQLYTLKLCENVSATNYFTVNLKVDYQENELTWESVTIKSNKLKFKSPASCFTGRYRITHPNTMLMSLDGLWNCNLSFIFCLSIPTRC